MDRKDFDDFRRRVEEIDLAKVGKIAGVVAVAILLLAASFTMVYTVEAEQEGVVLRLGRFQKIVQPGLHWKLPFGVDRVYPVPTRLVKKEEFGFRTAQPGVRTRYDRRSPVQREVSLMLTGDLNIADVQWIVQYRIQDPRKYVFQLRNPDETLRDVAESVMRLVIGDTSLTDVLTERREDIELEVKEKIQTTLERYESGILVTTVKLQDVNPPGDVLSAYEEVNEARLQKETSINQARQEYLREILEARGKALQTVSEAEGFKSKRINEAAGDVARFEALYAEYRNAPAVTRSRLYLETLGTVLPQLRRLFVLDGTAGAPLQVLDLERAAASLPTRRAASGTTGATTGTPGATTSTSPGRAVRTTSVTSGDTTGGRRSR